MKASDGWNKKNKKREKIHSINNHHNEAGRIIILICKENIYNSKS